MNSTAGNTSYIDKLQKAKSDQLYDTVFEIIDEIVPEPLGGAHRDPTAAAQFLREALIRNVKQLRKRSGSGLKADRYKRFRKLGVWKED